MISSVLFGSRRTFILNFAQGSGRRYFFHFREKERKYNKIICPYENLEISCLTKGALFIIVVKWCNEIKNILISARNKVYKTANFAMVETYWNIGKSII